MTLNAPADGKCGYIAFYDGKKVEVYADSSIQARDLAKTHFKPAKSKAHMVHVVLAEKDGKPVIHSTLG